MFNLYQQVDFHWIQSYFFLTVLMFISTAFEDLQDVPHLGQAFFFFFFFFFNE